MYMSISFTVIMASWPRLYIPTMRTLDPLEGLEVFFVEVTNEILSSMRVIRNVRLLDLTAL